MEKYENAIAECKKNMKEDNTCPDGHKYRTINPGHKKSNFKYCYNLPACAKSNNCWDLQNKLIKCTYKVKEKN